MLSLLDFSVEVKWWAFPDLNWGPARTYKELSRMLSLLDFSVEVKWWAFPDLNWGPADYESDALTS